MTRQKLDIDAALAAAAASLRVFGHGSLANRRADELRKVTAFRELAAAFEAAPWWRQIRHIHRLAELASLVGDLAEQSAKYAQDGSPEWGEPWQKLHDMELKARR